YKVKYRLPTEAEWEYACRGGHKISQIGKKADLPFHFETPSAALGAGQANLDAQKPYGDGKKGDWLRRTSTVGKKGEAKALGTFEVHGNVWEGCEDWYGEYYPYPEHYSGKSPGKDPKGPKSGSSQVYRGGSWSSSGRYCRAAFRGRVTLYEPFYFLGGQ